MLALAPMQDVTDRPFWELLTRYGGADLYFTEYFRVHATSHLEPWIRDSLVRNPTGRPAIAQMIGNDIPALVRTAKELQQLPDRCGRPESRLPCAGGVSEMRRAADCCGNRPASTPSSARCAML